MTWRTAPPPRGGASSGRPPLSLAPRRRRGGAARDWLGELSVWRRGALKGRGGERAREKGARRGVCRRGEVARGALHARSWRFGGFCVFCTRVSWRRGLPRSRAASRLVHVALRSPACVARVCGGGRRFVCPRGSVARVGGCKWGAAWSAASGTRVFGGGCTSAFAALRHGAAAEGLRGRLHKGAAGWGLQG